MALTGMYLHCLVLCTCFVLLGSLQFDAVKRCFHGRCSIYLAAFTALAKLDRNIQIVFPFSL